VLLYIYRLLLWAIDHIVKQSSSDLWKQSNSLVGINKRVLSNFCMKFEMPLIGSRVSHRRQDSSIGFGASVRANMRGNRLVDATITSSLLETV